MSGSVSHRTRLLRGLDRLPIRWRLAAISAGLTGIILLLFAIVIGGFTAHRISGDFNTQTAARFDALRNRLDLRLIDATPQRPEHYVLAGDGIAAASSDAFTVVKVWMRNRDGSFELIGGAHQNVDIGGPRSHRTRYGDLHVSTRAFNQQVNLPDGRPLPQQSLSLGLPPTATGPQGLAGQSSGDESSGTGVSLTAPLVVRIGRSYQAVDRTTRRIWTMLGLGVIGGVLLALAAGLALGARAMRPVRWMTSTARHIARTGDLDAKMPASRANDEIAQLSGTLQDMLDELAVAQATVDATLQRQREFVADASHELRTPLTAVQANLELLGLSVDGEDHEAVESALRSSRRMGRLVADLLLLARMDASRTTARHPVDLDSAILEAVDELEPQIGTHEIVLDLDPVTVDGVRDELVRMVANLVGNALRHTPDTTEIRVRLRASGDRGELVVEDDGPGIAPELRDRVFERFVRRGGEGAGSTGIGLAIVQAAARHHGGDARLEQTDPDAGTGARFVVTLAVLPADAPEAPDPPSADPEAADAEAPAKPSRIRLRRRRASPPGDA